MKRNKYSLTLRVLPAYCVACLCIFSSVESRAQFAALFNHRSTERTVRAAKWKTVERIHQSHIFYSSQSNRTVEHYDSLGRMVKSILHGTAHDLDVGIDRPYVTQKLFSYDSMGNLVRLEEYVNDTLMSSTVSTFDSSNRIVQQRTDYRKLPEPMVSRWEYFNGKVLIRQSTSRMEESRILQEFNSKGMLRYSYGLDFRDSIVHKNEFFYAEDSTTVIRERSGNDNDWTITDYLFEEDTLGVGQMPRDTDSKNMVKAPRVMMTRRDVTAVRPSGIVIRTQTEQLDEFGNVLISWTYAPNMRSSAPMELVSSFQTVILERY